MRSIVALTTDSKLRELADETERREGRAIADYQHVTFKKNKPTVVDARVGLKNGETRAVTLEAEKGSLSWNCSSCGGGSEAEKNKMCKHCVAVALALRDSDEPEEEAE